MKLLFFPENMNAVPIIIKSTEVVRRCLKSGKIFLRSSEDAILCIVIENTANTAKIIRNNESILCTGKGCDNCDAVNIGNSVIFMIPPATSIDETVIETVNIIFVIK